MMKSFPPANWRQQIRRNLPFPPGRGDDEFEAIITKFQQVYQLNLATGEVFVRTGAHTWDQPAWLELPDVVRARIHEALKNRDTLTQ